MEENLAYLKFLENLEKVDQAIRKEGDLEKMMANVLDAALSIFDSDRAWLLYPCDPKTVTWRIPMERTRAEYPGGFAGRINFPNIPDSQEELQAALDSAEPLVFDPRSGRPVPPTTGKPFSIKSQIILAVYPKLDKPWLFGMHQCSHARIWSDEDIRLFKEIGRRIGDGLNSLLFLHDLKNSEEQLRSTLASMVD